MLKYLTLIATLSVLMAGDYPFFRSDPSTELLFRSFRKNQNLSWLADYPVIQEDQLMTPWTKPDNHAGLTLFPQLYISNQIPDHQIHALSYSRWRNLSMFIQVSAFNDNYGPDYIGNSYSRLGLSGRVVNSLITYESEGFRFRFGRSPVFWGQSFESSIIQSAQYPSYENLTARYSMGNFSYEILAGQLSSEYIGDTRIKRNIAGHRIDWMPGNGNWVLGIGEQIIYTGEDRPVELFYLNPAVPYFFTALEGDETGNPDNDNSIIFAYGRYVYKPNLSVYFEFVLDEYQVDKNNVPNALGLKLGLDGGAVINGRQLTYQVEYTRIDSWTNIHHGQYTSWQNRGHPIGYRYGPDSRSIMCLADYELLPKKLLLTAKYTYLEKGQNNLSTVWASPGTRGDPFPTPPVTHHALLITSLRYYTKYGLLEAGWSNYPVGNAEIDGVIDSPKGSFFLKVQLVWGFGYDLE